MAKHKPTREEVAAKWLNQAARQPGPFINEIFCRGEAKKMLRELGACQKGKKK